MKPNAERDDHDEQPIALQDSSHRSEENRYRPFEPSKVKPNKTENCDSGQNQEPVEFVHHRRRQLQKEHINQAPESKTGGRQDSYDCGQLSDDVLGA